MFSLQSSPAREATRRSPACVHASSIARKQKLRPLAGRQAAFGLIPSHNCGSTCCLLTTTIFRWCAETPRPSVFRLLPVLSADNTGPPISVPMPTLCICARCRASICTSSAPIALTRSAKLIDPVAAQVGGLPAASGMARCHRSPAFGRPDWHSLAALGLDPTPRSHGCRAHS